MSPGRPNVHPGRTPSPKPDPLAPPYPKKTSPSRVTRSRPSPIQSRGRPTSSPQLRHFSPLIRPSPAISLWVLNHTHIRATFAHARDRPRGPEALRPIGGKAPGIRRGVPRGCPVAVNTRLSAPAPPPVLLCHAVSLSCPKNPRQNYRFAQERRHLQLGGAQNVAEWNRFRLPARPVPVEACPELAEWAGSGNNGVEGRQVI